MKGPASASLVRRAPAPDGALHRPSWRCTRTSMRASTATAATAGESTGSGEPGPGDASSSQDRARRDAQLDDPTLNKVPIALTMTQPLYSYLLDHTREHAALAALRAETAGLRGSNMQITPEQGCLLAVLAELNGTRRAVEVGVYTGYSALSVALVLPEDGILVALDKDESTMKVASKYFELAGVGHKVLPIIGDAQDSLQQLLLQYGPGSFDYAFLDADKRMYDVYYELLLQLVRPGGLVVVDNVLWHGRVADPTVDDKATAALRVFNDKLLSDPRVSLSIIPVGDGVALCRVRG